MALSLIAVWFLIGETHRGQQWTPALTLPQVRYGLSLLLLEGFCTPGIDYICRQVHRQLMRNELFAVGMPVARHPPHRSQRAVLPHWAPALSHHAKTLLRIRMIDTGDREPLIHVMLHTTPGDVAFMAPS
jgi:hypothetical protein